MSDDYLLILKNGIWYSTNCKDSKNAFYREGLKLGVVREFLCIIVQWVVMG